ncbi:hypothetical protein ACH4S8_04710 [Streptomyces sp. NPDC021080]|uniref:hypothetical protein n=1 Tax=Streptomyces sp. NPDC021080 TaxID=3365110 RepID=UPI0037ACB33C
MGRLLVVPVHLDALCLAGERQVTEPFTDFTRLPYTDPADGHDHQADMPYVSETLLSVPFQDQGFRLKAGVHLHWSLPDALTRLPSQGTAGTVPAVPNRWLVTRSAGGAVAQQWVVESDFLAEDNAGGVPYPYIADQMEGPEGLPYRLLGRRVPLSAWQSAGRTGSADPAEQACYLRMLTAVGYGEPAFASFYPHCHSVFGLHDPAFSGVPSEDVTYDVLGWYEDPGQDELAAVLAGPRDAGTGWSDVLRAALGWTVTDSGGAPERMVCWGRIAFAPGAGKHEDTAGDDTGVWVGNTPTEALAAHLGAVLGGTGLAPDDLENLLEALAFAEDLESAPLDVGLKLLEARHADTFRAVPSGNLWTVTDERSGQGADADLTALPRGAGAALNTLNLAQAACDRAGAELTGLRQELYADWYRYMLCVYPPDIGRDSWPDPDQVLFHLRRQAAVIGRRTALAEALGQDRDAARAAAEAVLPDGYRLLPGPAPQYYLPNEPVVLLTGPAANPSDRFGQDGLLECQVTDGDIPAGAEALRALRDTVAALPALAALTRTWETQPWHPLLLQWEAEFFPAGPNGNLGRPADRDFRTDFITAAYTLPADQVELRPRAAGGAVLAKGANVYTGGAVLSPSARPLLAARILRYLAGPVLAALDGTVTEEAFTADPEPALDRFLASGAADQRAATLIAVHRHLSANEQNNLAQALGGFDDALLMRRLARQLPVADPLGFPDHRAVTETEVAPAVAGESRYTPQPLSDFNPIRAGAMRLLRLRMVDTFGTVRDVPVDTVGTTSQLRVEGHPGWVGLPPRLAQPARLSLRWLDADSDLAEMNDIPATSPVCGWLLANHLDGSVAVHAADGSALGAVYALPGDPEPTGGSGATTVPALWQPAPGRAPVPVDGIGNPHLRAVVARLRGSGPDGVAAFLGTLDEALAAVEPEDYALHRNRALLVSRPVAVVRATVSLELAGRPALHQDWNVFRQDLRRGGCESNGFTRVRFPVRLGDHGRLGDGLVGYWPEESDGRLGPVLHSLTDGDETEDAALFQAIDAPARALTMLVDPRGAVHACCGILPAKALRIPDAHYRDALAAMEIAFLTAPVLGDGAAAAPDLPLPDEPGFVWCWLERDAPSGTGWLRTGSEPLIDRAAVLTAFPGDPGLWRQLTDAGWLTPLDDDTALVTPVEQRPALPAAPVGLADALTALLERPALAQPRQDASFAARPTAREGWLTLRPRPTTNTGRQ